MYYRGAHLILYCFSLDDKTTLNEVKYWINKVNRSEDNNKHSIMIGIKKDLWNKDNFSEDDIRDISDSFNIPYILVSCKDIKDVDKCFHHIFEETIKNVDISRKVPKYFWHMLLYVKNDADFETEVRLA